MVEPGATGGLLYRWPAAARFGRVVPKTKFYEHAKVSRTVRDRFVDEVQRITWSYKLADATIHLRGDDGVAEIQVFEINAKAGEVDDAVLAAIDKAVLFPIIFEINRGKANDAETKMVAGYKQPTSRNARVDHYFETEWLPSDTERTALPTAIDLAGLYTALLTPLLPTAPRRGERLSQTTKRLERASKAGREIAALERRMRNEPQLNRKMELRRQVTSLKHDLAALLDPDRPTTEDPKWTS